ncbi:MAG TPA: ABC transporter permease, partial [Bryobacteraceae bacterium]|nr:ABC transporter permease [Bryobacteraceae bacterium]
MKLLQLLTWPYVRKHKLRMLLTLAGVMLGVAVFVGMHTANMTIQSAFQRTVDRIAGKSQLQVTAGETGFPEEVLERVQSLRELSAASPVIEAALATPQGTLLVLGVDMTGDTSLREYDLEGEDEDVIDDPLIFLAQPDSLIVSGQFAERTGLKRGSKLTLKTMGGQKTFTIRGVMKSTGLATVFGGNLAIMDIYAAQAVFGRGRLFDRVDIGLAEGITVKQARQKLQTMLGSGFQVEPPEARGTHFESMVRGLTISINMASLFALMIGVFIIYNSFSIAITQRRGEIGVLRALGATR